MHETLGQRDAVSNDNNNRRRLLVSGAVALCAAFLPTALDAVRQSTGALAEARQVTSMLDDGTPLERRIERIRPDDEGRRAYVTTGYVELLDIHNSDVGFLTIERWDYGNADNLVIEVCPRGNIRTQQCDTKEGGRTRIVDENTDGTAEVVTTEEYVGDSLHLREYDANAPTTHKHKTGAQMIYRRIMGFTRKARAQLHEQQKAPRQMGA